VYQCYGDERLLRDRYPAMKAWVEYVDSVNPNHLWINRSNNNFGDWLNVQDDTPRDVLATAYFAHSTDLLRKSAEVLGKTDDAEHYRQLFEEIRTAYQQNFVNSEGVIKGDTQTGYVMALSFGLLPDEQRPAAAKRLADHITIDRKTHLSTGFVGSGMLNPTLTSVGQTELAYKLLLTDTYPSWLYSIRQGATTIWERWDGWTKEKGFQDPGMNSFNHYSFGAVGQWIYTTIGGIDFDEPGYKHIVVHPVPGPGVTWAKTSLDSIRGPISCDWKQTGGKFDLNVTIPGNTTADVYVPAKSTDDVTLNGDSASMSDGVSIGGMKDGCVIFRVGSGKYHFEIGKK
jgi:alpha-L-rhamnosidase